MSSSLEKELEYQYKQVPTNDTEKETEKEVESYGLGVRHFQCLILFVCLCIIFIVRAHLGITIVAMVDDTVLLNNTKYNRSITFVNDTHYNNVKELITDSNALNIKSETIGNSTVENMTKNSNDEETDASWNVNRKYKWTKPVQEMVLSSFFLGYFLMMFPMGLVCQRWGGKLPLQIALSITGVTSITTPWLAVWGGWKAVCATRIAQGLCQAGVYPSTIALIASWSPVSERGRLISYVFTGTVMGTVVAFQVGGILAASSWGWPSTFWATGVLNLLAFALLTVFVSATPHIHKSITEKERKYILAGARNTKSIQKLRTPWCKILKSKHVWAIFCTHVGCGTAFFFILTQMSSYLHFICGVDVKRSGLLSSLPYIGNFFSGILIGYLSDLWTNGSVLSVKKARIICNSIAATGIALCLTALSFTSSTTLAVNCLVLGLMCQAAMNPGFMVNYIDIAPNYSAILTATGNVLMNLGVLTLPMLVSNIVTDVSDPYKWRIVMFIVAGVSFFTNIVFVAFMTADALPWNEPAADEGDRRGTYPLKNEGTQMKMDIFKE